MNKLIVLTPEIEVSIIKLWNQGKNSAFIISCKLNISIVYVINTLSKNGLFFVIKTKLKENEKR